jgi:hypothetical protein
MNTLEEILKEANKYLRPLPEEADPTKMNEEDYIQSIEMRERLEPIERAEIEPTRELKRATLGVEEPPYTPEELQRAKELNVHPNRIRHTMKIEEQEANKNKKEKVVGLPEEPPYTPEELQRAKELNVHPNRIRHTMKYERQAEEKGMTPEEYLKNEALTLEKLEAIERAEFKPIEPMEFKPREFKRAEDIRSIEMAPKQEIKEFEKLSPLGSGAIMRAQQFMIPEYDPEDQIMYDDISREQLEYQRRLDELQKLRERK